MNEHIVIKNCYIEAMYPSARECESDHLHVEDGNFLMPEGCEVAGDSRRASAKSRTRSKGAKV